MNLEKLSSAMSRLFFFGALLLLGLAVLERVVNFLGYTILRSYGAGRFLEFAGILMVFVIAVLLRQIREALKTKP
jgi:hypothetical protein